MHHISNSCKISDGIYSFINPEFWFDQSFNKDTMKKEIKAIDFFCGAGGVTCGFQTAGIKVIAGIDVDNDSEKTYTINNRYKNYKHWKNDSEDEGPVYLKENISKIEPKDLVKRLKIKRNDPNLVFIGCSPCQFWSQINTTKNKSQTTKHLLWEFGKLVKYFKPGYIFVENVPGMKRREKESKLFDFITMLRDIGYTVQEQIVNVSQWGLPQKRIRYFLLATHTKRDIRIPKKLKIKTQTVRDAIGKYPQIKSGNKDNNDTQYIVSTLAEINIKRLKNTPPEGKRIAWANNPELQLKCYKGKDNIFKDVYGRMIWDQPAPTITTKFMCISNGCFAHPEQNRGLSVREGASLQTFPENYVFYSPYLNSKAKQIGNAVPPKSAEIIANIILGNQINELEDKDKTF